jgi:DNA-directed RNA polymerase beta subunit
MRTPQELFHQMVSGVSEGVHAALSFEAPGFALSVADVHADAMPDAHDWSAQKEAKLAGRTWGTPIRATVNLAHAAGHTEQQSVLLGTMPTPTNRHTFIVNGKEYQVSSQRRLRPGMYTKVNRLGESRADFNLAKGRNFSLGVDPLKNEIHMRFGGTRVPLAPMMRNVFGVHSLGLGPAFDHPGSPDKDLDALRTLHGALMPNKVIPSVPQDLIASLVTSFGHSEMDPELNRMTVGAPHTSVTAPALLDASKHLLEVSRGERLPTERDDLAFAELHGVEDFLKEGLAKNKGLIAAKVRTKLSRGAKLADIDFRGIVQPHIRGFFTSSALSSTPMQINPLEMKENAYKITSMGPGGISDANAIPVEVRAIHPSSAGFIDPVRTPDNAKAGIDVRASMSASKVGRRLVTSVINARTGHPESLSAQELFHKTVAHDLEPEENGVVRAIRGGHLVEARRADIDYHIQTDKQFTVSTACVPFIQSSHAHRIAMGAKMLGQALSLVDREAPIVDTPHSDMALADILPRATASGIVTRADGGQIHIHDGGGKTHVVHYPHEFLLNGGSYLHADPTVAVGHRVEAGDVLAETNFSRGHRLALGRNMTVAYLPLKGHNYEDGIVVTEQGASKLTSNHMHLEEVAHDGANVHSLARFVAHHPGKFGRAQLAGLDADGVVKPGTILKTGDPLMAILRERPASPEQLQMSNVSKKLANPYADASLTWDKACEGRVSSVSKSGDGYKVTVISRSPLQVGDKLAGRFGNKGVVTMILPDHEAPHTASGEVPDILINSAGIVSRMNPGQLYEVAAAKALKALGKDHAKFPQFGLGDTHAAIEKLVKASGVTPSETMYDPKTGLALKDPVLMGPMYMLKLFKQAETGYSARAGGKYDIDLRPSKGGEEGAKSIGALDLFGLIAHGSKNFLRDSATYKAERNPEVLQSMWRGKPLPPPHTTFAYQKFEGMVRGMGLDLKKDGSKIQILPMTDADIMKVSSGAIARPLIVNERPDPVTGLPFRPEAGGLFDPAATGGLLGKRWSHIELPEPVLNPMFSRPTRVLLGLDKAGLRTAIANEGGAGIRQRLAGIDPVKRTLELKAELSRTNNVAKRDGLYKQLKYLAPLVAHGIAPSDAYVLTKFPVIPPSMRPVYPDADTGQVVSADANKLYQHLMLVGDQLRHHGTDGDPETAKELRLGLHDAVMAVQGLDATAASQASTPEPQGFLKVITGTSAKDGFFQSKLISRRQDIAGRGVAVPNPHLGLDAIGLPEPMAWTLYRHHAVGELVKAGIGLDAAAKDIKERTPRAMIALQAAMAAYPCVLSRAPALHRFNIQAFKPQLVAGKSIEVNTLIHKGFNLDHDGDACSVHVPISPAAAQDAFRMMPSQNLYHTLDRSPVHVPTQETVLGLWKATRPQTPDDKTVHFASKEEALAAYHGGKIRVDQTIHVGPL